MNSKVLVADSQFLSRIGLLNLLAKEDGVQVIDSVQNNDGLELSLRKNEIDLVIIDYNHEGKFGSEAIALIKEINPFTKILAISNDDNRQRIYEVIERGVVSYVTKNCSELEIKTALTNTIRGEKFFCGKVLNVILEKSFGKDKATNPLSSREIEIIKLIAKGKVAKQISDELFISVHTIYTHRKNIMRKLELSSPVELIMYAVNNGIVDLDSK